MKLIVWSVMLVGLVALSGCSKPAEEGGAAGVKKKLVIGMDASYPPFEMLDAQGQVAGVSADLGRALAADLGREVEFRNIAFEGLVLALKSGVVDCVISSMTATDEKRQSIEFSDPYVKIVLALLVSNKSPVQDVSELNAAGRRVVVRLGTTGEGYAKKHLPLAKIISLDSDTASVLEVAQGGADAWIYDRLSVTRYHERHPDTTRMILKPVQEEVWAIGLRQGEDELKAKINQFLAKFRAEGGFEKLGEKHLSAEKKLMEKEGVPFVFDVGGK